MYTGNNLCDMCIDIMVWWSRHLPLSYGEINILLFVILQPALILMFFVTTLLAASKNQKIKKATVVFSIFAIFVLILFAIALVAIPIIDVGTDLRTL